MRPTSCGRDQRGAGGRERPGICLGWRLPGREDDDRRNNVAGRTLQEEPPTGAVAVSGGTRTDWGAQMTDAPGGRRDCELQDRGPAGW
ncbi:hypothetical protein NDU88_002890 [Pleurodeles waltl]|uniref:Uncharacterized protein n=1 Tax=Pleurodeles waltl TaxID=8319 RepID=A0AAV7M7A3_PLEWA|nr:hypothetical protein NDU88_002890 [Pleurodeles waltl]